MLQRILAEISDRLAEQPLTPDEEFAAIDGLAKVFPQFCGITPLSAIENADELFEEN